MNLVTFVIALAMWQHVAVPLNQGTVVPVPRPNLTPGAVMTLDSALVCKPGYSSTVRNVPQSEKDEVYRLYGVKPHHPECCEVDHLISLELGGSNDIKNLWPEPYLPKPGAHEKDVLENTLHHLVCTGKMKLPEAQKAISTDWYKAYRKYVLKASTRGAL